MHVKKSLKGVWDPKFSTCSVVFSNKLFVYKISFDYYKQRMSYIVTIVHLIIFLFTSKPGNVTNSTFFAKVLPKFCQNFEDSEQIFYATDSYFFHLYFQMTK